VAGGGAKAAGGAEEAEQGKERLAGSKESLADSGRALLSAAVAGDWLPAPQAAVYLLLSCGGCGSALAAAIADGGSAGPETGFGSATVAALGVETGLNVVALTVAAGPVAAAFLMRVLFRDSMHPFWPFHKEGGGVLALHTVVGLLCTVVPVYHTVSSLLGTRRQEVLWL
jgi:hypothetical protein